jgi:hypothetical protein
MRRWAASATARVSALLLAALLLGACGSTHPQMTPRPGPSASRVREGIALATRSTAADFPAVRGRTLRQIGRRVAGGPQLVVGTSVIEPGRARVAYGVIDPHGGALLGQSAIYIANGLDSRARGPYPAAAESLIVDPRDRSRQAVHDYDAQAFIYAAHIALRASGRITVLAVVHQAAHLTGALAQLDVALAPQIPQVGSVAPRVHTDTVRSARGNLASIDTRHPHDDMHRSDLAQVPGRRPVALLFATPALCQSRLCGPVVDIATNLERRYRGRVTFIHEEVYNHNDPRRGLRPSPRAYGLPSEPWLFTINRRGRIATRLEGAFGYQAFDELIQRALR